MHPFFSIITPVYNCRKYIRKCIESVIEQTYTSWELILVDDGSTDSSGEICDIFCSDPRIKVIHQDNMGELKSRLRGMSLAGGEYELGLDADDYLDKNCLKIIKKAIDVSGSDLIFFGYRLVGKQKGNITSFLEAGEKYSRREILEEIISNTNHSLCNKAIRTEIVRQTKYYFCPRQKLSINADYMLIVPIICNISTGYVIDDILYNYRIYGKSASHLCKVQHIFDTGLVTRDVIRSLKKAGIMDTDIMDKIYAAYLKMIGFRIVRLFGDKKITKEDCRRIHQSRIYRNSKRAECLENFDRNELRVLKLFRFRQYWALRFMAKSFK